MGPILVKGLTFVGNIYAIPGIVGGLLGYCQRRSLSPIPVKDNKNGRRVGVLGIRM